MILTISYGIADSEITKFLSALESGKIRAHFPSELIQFKILDERYKKRGQPALPPLHLQGTLSIKYGIEFFRDQISENLIRFQLIHSLFGNLGLVVLSYKGGSNSDLDYELPKFPSIDEAREIHGAFPKGKPFLFADELSEEDLEFGLQAETFEPGHLFERRIKIQQDILQAFLESIRISLGASITEEWDTSTQEFIVKLEFRNALSKINSFLSQYESEGELIVSRFSDTNRVIYFDMTHKILGRIGKLYEDVDSTHKCNFDG